MNKDLINSANPFDVLHAAYAALSGAQDKRPEAQVLGFAVLFREAATVLRLDHSELMRIAESICKDADAPWFSNVRALREYIDKEVKRG